MAYFRASAEKITFDRRYRELLREAEQHRLAQHATTHVDHARPHSARAALRTLAAWLTLLQHPTRLPAPRRLH